MRLVHRAYVEVEEASLHNMTRFEPLADASLASTVALGVDTLGDPSEPPLSEGVRKSGCAKLAWVASFLLAVCSA